MLSGLVDLPRLIIVGPVSALALLTVAYTGSAGILWIVRPIFVTPAILALWPLVAFLAWTYSTFLWYAPSVAGLQNVLVLSVFVGFALLISYESYRTPGFAELVRKTVAWAVWLAAVLYVISLLVSRLGVYLYIGPRSFAMVALLGVACQLGAWRSGRSGALWQAVLLTVLIGASFSRMALFVALALFPLSRLSLRHFRSWVQMVLLTAIIAFSTYLAVTYIQPLNERFFAGDRAYEVANVTINTSGRTEIWATVWDSALKAPITGQGAGSSEEVLHETDPNGAQHPHNDYLRLLHDYGLLGLGLWLLGYSSLLWVIGRSFVRANREKDNEAALHLTALLGLTGVALLMITDNTVVYVFVMAPLGALVGASLGRAGHQQPWRVH
jgi:O-antigen ligase